MTVGTLETLRLSQQDGPTPVRPAQVFSTALLWNLLSIRRLVELTPPCCCRVINVRMRIVMSNSHNLLAMLWYVMERCHPWHQAKSQVDLQYYSFTVKIFLWLQFPTILLLFLKPLNYSVTLWLSPLTTPQLATFQGWRDEWILLCRGFVTHWRT